MKRQPEGLDVVPFTPDWSLTFEENWERYREAYRRIYGEYPPSEIESKKSKSVPPPQRSR